MKQPNTSTSPQQQQQQSSSTLGGGMKEEITLKGNINENYVFVETALNKQIEVKIMKIFKTKNFNIYSLLT